MKMARYFSKMFWHQMYVIFLWKWKPELRALTPVDTLERWVKKTPKKKPFSDIILDVSKHHCHLPKLTFVLLYFHVVFFCLELRSCVFSPEDSWQFSLLSESCDFLFGLSPPTIFSKRFFSLDLSSFRAAIVLLLRSARSHCDGRDC